MIDDTLADYKELGRLQGEEMIRKIYEKSLLRHLEQVKPTDQYSRGYRDALEYAILTLNIKPE